VIQEDGFWYVASKDRTPGVPEITVSAKGVANGLTTEYNDGYDFGPDSYDPNSTAKPPYTQTSGIKEAHDYAISVGIPNPGGGANHIFIPEIHILRGNYTIYDGFIVSGNGNIIENYVFKGETSMAPWIMCNNTGFAITLDASSFNNSNIEVSNMQPQYVSNADGFMTATLDSNGYPNLSGCPIAMYNMNISNGGWNKYPIYLSGTTITLYNWQNYGNQAWFSGTSISFFGGVTGGEYIYGTPMLQLVGISGGESYASPGGYFTLNNVITVSVFGGDMQYGRSISFNLLSNVNQISVIGFYTIVQNNFQEPFLINNTGGAITVDYLYIRGLQTTLPTSLISNSTGSTTNIIYPDIKYCNYTGLPIAIPTLSANPPVSGTVYQNTNPYDIEIDLPVYATTSGTAGYVTVAKGSSSSSLTTIGNQFVNGSTSSTSVDIIRLRVPAGWYYEFTSSGVTFGTASVFAD
jgi:hypothetical protein